jgi:hypothetical protein
MENNNNPEINRLNMETSKSLAESLRGWAGLDAPKAPVASSFLNGSTAQMIKESNNNNEIFPKSNATTFSFGLINTISALRNSSLNDIPAGKMMLEKYEGLLLQKGISEAFIIEGFLNDLRSFSWENSVPSVLENVNSIFENRRREVEVVKTYETIKNTPGKDLFTDATDQMKNWLLSEKKSSDLLVHGLKRFGFNPLVRNLVSFLSLYENKNPNKFNLGVDNNVCEVTNLYSPIMVTESGSIFFSSGKFLKINDADNSITECSNDEVSEEFQNKSGIISDRDVVIEGNRISLNLGNNKVDIVFEDEEKKIFFNGKAIKESDLPAAVSVTTNSLLENSSYKSAKALFIAKTAEEIVDIDFGKKIKSKVYEGVEANIFKYADKIYVQTVNPAMRLNNLYEANATQAINMVRDFIKYDISESLTEFLQGEQAYLSVMKNDKNDIVKNIGILENELTKINKVKSENPLIANSKELLSLEESLENELQTLKDKWNQVNVEISRFETSAKSVSVNEEMGYPIDTEVRVKRNGSKGKIVGVDGSSKTYTILFKEGKTGEYFFSDVEDLSDEVDNYDIKAPELNLEFSEEANESLDQNFAEAPGPNGSKHYDKMFMNMVKKHMAAAPSKEAKGDPKFIDDEKNANMAEVKGEGKKSPITKKPKLKGQNLVTAPGKSAGKGKKFIEDTKDSNLAKAPSSVIKSASKFIEDLKDHNLALKESQKNSHIEKAPKAKVAKPKKFIEKEEHANLEEAPGNHNKNGKKFVEDQKRANLASAPKTKKK